MANTIGNRPPAIVPTQASTASSSAAATSSAPAPADSFSRASSSSAATSSSTGRVTPSQSIDEIKNGSDDMIKAFTPEEIRGMTTGQFKAYSARVTGDTKKGIKGIDGGMESLSKDQQKAFVRKNIMQGLVAEFKKEASKYDKP